MLLQLGDTSLPEQGPDLTRPDDVDLDLLKKIHHVLLEVRRLAPISARSSWRFRVEVRARTRN